jgi:hypothetical protein
MKKSRFNLSSIDDILKKFDDGKTADEITHNHVVSEPSFYKWGFQVKRIYSNLVLDLVIAKYIIDKKHYSLYITSALLMIYIFKA